MSLRSRLHDKNARQVAQPRAWVSRFVVFGTLVAAVAFAPSPAAACSGEVAVREDVVKVSAHETAMAMSHVGSSMWVRIAFEGNPQNFGMLIPTKPGASVAVGEPEFFDTLREATTPVIRSSLSESGRAGCGCGAAASGDEANDGSGGVTVVSRANVGPYATVTLSATEPDALSKWLDENGFVIDPAAKDAAAAYVAEGLDFIAIKFRAGATATRLPPIRVDTDTHDMRVLLRMALAGAGERTDMVLYVLDTVRQRPQNFPETVIAPGLITVDASGASNYDATVERAMASGDNRTWVTEFAGTVDASEYENICRNMKFGADAGGPTVDPLPDAGTVMSDAALGDAWTPADGATDAAVATDAAPGVDAEAPIDTPAPAATCSSADLLRRSSAGSKEVYVTRLRARLSRAALGSDMVLEPHPDQKGVSRYIDAGTAPTASIAGGALRGQGGTLLTAFGTALALALLRRRSRRRG